MSLSHSFLFYGASFWSLEPEKLKFPFEAEAEAAEAQAESPQSPVLVSVPVAVGEAEKPKQNPNQTKTKAADMATLQLQAELNPPLPSPLLSSKFDASATNSQTHTHIETQTIPELDNELGQFEGSQQKGDLPLSFALAKRVVRRRGSIDAKHNNNYSCRYGYKFKCRYRYTDTVLSCREQQHQLSTLWPHISAEIHSDALRTLTPRPWPRPPVAGPLSRCQCRIQARLASQSVSFAASVNVWESATGFSWNSSGHFKSATYLAVLMRL